MLLPFMGGKAFSASPKLEDACESHGGVLFIRIHPLLAERLPQTPQPDSLLPWPPIRSSIKTHSALIHVLAALGALSLEGKGPRLRDIKL